MKKQGIFLIVFGIITANFFWFSPIKVEAQVELGAGCYCNFLKPGQPPMSGLIDTIKGPGQCSGQQVLDDGTQLLDCGWVVEKDGCQCELPTGDLEAVEKISHYEDCNGEDNLAKINQYYNGQKGFINCQWVGAGGPKPTTYGKIKSCEDVNNTFDCSYKNPNVLKFCVTECKALPGCSFNTKTKTCEKATLSLPDASALNPIGTTSVQDLLGRVIKMAMGIMGSIALAMFVIAGVLWMTSAGNSERADQGKKIVVWSSLGIIVILSSYALVKFLFEIVQ